MSGKQRNSGISVIRLKDPGVQDEIERSAPGTQIASTAGKQQFPVEPLSDRTAAMLTVVILSAGALALMAVIALSLIMLF
jgi:hypothetical protein